eukprot:CAMPEP_0113890044 /NCGR_PEP_ID=MMETSP0780_2-20120614/13887_1 /TAXON_ID=652834 /ORGANISM="Palpitomonas bilix" /LENGTH=315 /DNA_ID=CAMNT_0000879317 /DNA_START=546 /DNA_END=1490 /DNA_ORIENTATION=+ /assembly_acc=CAM_ASM_000599
MARITSLAFELKDGERVKARASIEGKCMRVSRKVEELRLQAYACQLLSPAQRRRFISTPLSLRKFLSYIFFLPALFTGPTFPYRDWRAFMEGGLRDFSGNEDGARMVFSRVQPPSSARATVVHLTSSAFWFFILVVTWRLFPTSYLLEEDFFSRSLLFRLGYVVASLQCDFLKYYFVFGLGEASIIGCGFGFNGYGPGITRPQGVHRHPRFDRYISLDPLQFLSATSPFEIGREWNRTIGLWLRYTVYERWAPMRVRIDEKVEVESISSGSDASDSEEKEWKAVSSRGRKYKIQKEDDAARNVANILTFVISSLW